MEIITKDMGVSNQRVVLIDGKEFATAIYDPVQKVMHLRFKYNGKIEFLHYSNFKRVQTWPGVEKIVRNWAERERIDWVQKLLKTSSKNNDM